MAGKSLGELTTIAASAIEGSKDKMLLWDNSETGSNRTKSIVVDEFKKFFATPAITPNTITSQNTTPAYTSITSNAVLDIASVTVPDAGVWAVYLQDIVAIRYPLAGSIGSQPLTVQTYVDTASNGRMSGHPPHCKLILILPAMAGFTRI